MLENPGQRGSREATRRDFRNLNRAYIMARRKGDYERAFAISQLGDEMGIPVGRTANDAELSGVGATRYASQFPEARPQNLSGGYLTPGQQGPPATPEQAGGLLPPPVLPQSQPSATGGFQSQAAGLSGFDFRHSRDGGPGVGGYSFAQTNPIPAFRNATDARGAMPAIPKPGTLPPRPVPTSSPATPVQPLQPGEMPPAGQMSAGGGIGQSFASLLRKKRPALPLVASAY